jgi:RHS repeat-associated protein
VETFVSIGFIPTRSAPCPADARRRRHRLRAALVGVATVGLLLSGLSPALATPTTPPNVSVAVSESLQPVLLATATSGTGSGNNDHKMRFFARTIGSTTWNLLNGVQTIGTTGTARLGAGLAIGQRFEYQVEHCDVSGCLTTSVKTGQVSPELGAGQRPGATGIPFTLGDALTAQVDVGSGNLMVQAAGVTLPRVSSDLNVGAVYNSLPAAGLGDSSVPGSQSAFFNSTLALGWRLSTGAGEYLRVQPNTGVAVYYGPGGLTGAFFPDGATAYKSPPGFKMDLKKATGGGWELFDHDSGQTRLFNASGQLTTLRDRNSNDTTFTYDNSGSTPALTTITTDQGPTSARTLDVVYSGPRVAQLNQTAPAGSGLSNRSVSFTYSGSGSALRLTGMTDTLGRATTFTYTGAGFLASVTAPGGILTEFGYDAPTGRVTSITQPTATAGTNAVTRIDYPDAQTMRVAEPNTDQAQPIGSVPRTTYTLTTDGQRLPASATDASGAARSATYNSNLDVLTATDTAGTTSASYNPDVNGGESLTGLTGASGATASFGYSGTARATRYQPQTSTDGQNNATTYSYNGAGNRTSATNASSSVASVDYANNGTITTSTSVNGAVTSYAYDANKQLTSITPPANNSLGGRSYTYDAFGRIATYTSGRGITETYTYDAADRLTTIAYSGTGSTGGNVTYTYNTPGWQTSRVDPSGTTTYTYDPLGRLASRKHSINDITVAYAYDRTGNIATETTTVPGVTGKTTTYTYDARNLATRMTLANGLLIDFAYDTAGRRTDTWQGTNAAHTTWDAHTTTTYNGAGQVTRVWTAKASNNNDRVSDLTYNYTSPGPSTAGCTTAPPVNTVTDLRWSMTDNVTGQVTAYCYDRQNRLVSAVAAAAGATPAVDFRYTYDANGNRTQLTENGTVTEALTHNSADQITSNGYTYDAGGNPTATPDLGTVQYSRDEQMTRRDYTSGGNPAGASYVYAGTNQVEFLQIRISSTAGRTYTYGREDANGLPQIAAFSSNLAAPTAGNTAYIAHDPNGTPIALTAWTGQTHFYAEDSLGSTVALINQDGAYTADYNYDPNGEVTVTNPSGTSAINTFNPFRYAGGTYDYSSNLILFGQRWYDPATGRFTQQDALETIGDPSRSNRYEYAASNPTNYVDPTGADYASPYDRPNPYAVNTRAYRPSYSATYSPSSAQVRRCLVAGAGAALTGARIPGIQGPPGAVGGALVGCASGVLGG